MLAEDAVGEREAVFRALGDDATAVAERSFALVVGDDQGVALGLVGTVHGTVYAVWEAEFFYFCGDFDLENKAMFVLFQIIQQICRKFCVIQKFLF